MAGFLVWAVDWASGFAGCWAQEGHDASEQRTAETPRRNRANGDCRTPILRNEQDTLWSGGKQSARSGRVPQKHEGLSRPLLTKKKRIVLDMANKKRNTVACFEVGYVSSSFLHGADDWYPTPPR